MNQSSIDLESIPDRLYYKIGEVSQIVGVKPHVLRYWETEFPMIKPYKKDSKQRLYRKRDLRLLLMIKKLLYEEMYTIAGAKQVLKKLKEQDTGAKDRQLYFKFYQENYKAQLRDIKKELLEIKKILS
ncbi:MAG: MerR family transcriptional regulator [Deltaproteobacteria bacterium]|nr:MAG: MerR family transcriptional regulator [Deltaproteobacteria bacterium]